MQKSYLSILLIYSLLQNTQGQPLQPEGINCLRTNAVIEGKRFEDKRYLKFFALLLQDTCTTYNRFTNYFYPANGHKINQPQRYFKAFIVDSIRTVLAEKVYKTMNTDVYRYIRLYMGFVDDNNDTIIVVQFLKPREFRNDKFYSKQMNLIAQKNKKLCFVVLKEIENELTVESSFPTGFLLGN
jgi:hypothetical protein